MNPSSQSYAVTRANERECPLLMVSLGSVLEQYREYIDKPESRVYKKLSVKLYGKGVVLDAPADGANLRMKKHQIARAGQVILSEIWGKKGAIGFVPPEGEGALCTSHFFLFDIRPDKAIHGWLDAIFRSNFLASSLDAEAHGTTGYAAIRPNQFLSMEIPLPPLPEQKRIVAKVQSLTSKIDEARELRESINTDRIAALRSLFRRITDGAPRRPMSEIAPLERRPVQIKEDECYPELGIRSFGRGTFHKPALKGSEITWQKLFRIHSGDIVLSNIKAWEGAIGVATEEDHNRVGSHRYLTCVVNPDAATANFVCFYLLTREGLEHVGHASPGSADRNRTLGMRALMGIPVPVPPLHMQHNFDCAHRQMTETTVAEADSGKKLNALMPSILDRAFKGEL
jgi:type I restriction enzyme S subunit